MPAALSGQARGIAPGRQRGEYRIEMLDRFVRAADHQAVAAIETPDTAAGADIDIVQALVPEPGGAIDVVM